MGRTVKKEKVKWLVFNRYYLITEDIEDNITEDWKLVGTTYAVSEAQAINNVRHRVMGDYGTSQYKPIATSGYWENGFDWMARKGE